MPKAALIFQRSFQNLTDMNFKLGHIFLSVKKKYEADGLNPENARGLSWKKSLNALISQ